MGSMVERAQIIAKGVVQGVGFRPFVYNLAGTLGLYGYVTNTSEGVLIEIEGARIPEFIHRLQTDAPPLSNITDMTVSQLPLHGYSDFTIHQSVDRSAGLPFTLVSPDISICDDCLQEMLDPDNRRYLYPFINCTNCGPRYSITRCVPYDRPNTTMADFIMCPDCLREYHDPTDRRFHAQPNACPTCGPQVELSVRNSFGNCSPIESFEDKIRGQASLGVKNGEAIQQAVQMLQNGGIVAVKGIGGFHIACDAENDAAVKRLREKKRKSNKPFAVMAPDIQGIAHFCDVTESEKKLLLSGRRPIVLLRKRNDHGLSDAVSPNNNFIGYMLPYTPLHYLLFRHTLGADRDVNEPRFKALVMTSGNLFEEPIVRDNDEAQKKLSDIVDGFLLHNREIFMRVDDSVVRSRSGGWGVGSTINPERRTHSSELLFMRRSRGYAPDPITLLDEGPEVLGCGADLKNTFTLTKGKFAIPSQHIGDMENYETLRFFEECLANLKRVYRAEPQAIVHDLHPGYLSTRWALEQVSGSRVLGPGKSAIQIFAIQHHYAHIGAVMAEHGLKSEVIGVAFDGTGYGTDGQLWGGEFLIADIDGFERLGQFQYIPLPGGETAIREPWRTAVSYLMQACGDEAWEYIERTGFDRRYKRGDIDNVMAVARSRELSPLASGAGRVFDAVSALLGICDFNTFEGEAAMALESYVRGGIDDEYHVEFLRENDYTVVDYSPTIKGIVTDIVRRLDNNTIATKFHNTVATVVRTMVLQLSNKRGIREVALSGGTFQNSYLLLRAARLLISEGLNVYTNHKVPCNDACISLGQAYLIRERMKKC